MKIRWTQGLPRGRPLDGVESWLYKPGMTTMAPPKLINLHRQATELLAQRVLDGTYAIGQALPIEPVLCLELGISRTTVRSAVRELAAKGMLEVGPSRGTRVRPRAQWNLLDAEVMRWRIRLGVDRKLIEDIYELRECFEPRASQLAAERGSAEDHAQIEKAFNALAASREEGGQHSVEADVAFHTAILSSAGNEYIAALSTIVTMALRVSFEIARKRRQLAKSDIDQHLLINDAILARNGKHAYDVTERLLVASKKVQTDAAGPRS